MRRSPLRLAALPLFGALLGCGGAGADASVDGGVGACALSLDTSPSGALALGARVRVAAVPTAGPLPFSFAWDVSSPSGAAVAPILDLDPAVIVVPLDAAGPFSVHVAATAADGDRCEAGVVLNALDPAGQRASYRLRFTAPDLAGLPRQEALLEVVGGTPLAGLLFALQAGVAVEVPLRDPAGAPLPGFVRLDPTGGGASVEGRAGADGRFRARVLADLFDVLLVPEAAELAPLRLAAVARAVLPAGLALPDAGLSWAGRASAADGAGGSVPVGGVRLALGARDGGVPGGLGLSDGAGRFALAGRPGSYRLAAVPPTASGLPELLADGVPLADPVEGADVRWLAPPIEADVGGARVVDADGQPLLGAALVTFIGLDLPAGEVALPGGLTIPAVGVVRRVVATDPEGLLPDVRLPAGSYDLVVEPLAPDAQRGLTRLEAIELSGAGLLGAELRLARPRTLTGAVLAADGSAPPAGTRVLALDRGGSGSPREAVIDAAGRFSLRLDDAGLYDLVATPPPEAPYGLGRLAGVRAAAGPPQVTLPIGLSLEGRVLTPPGFRAAGVLVQALCDGCPDPTPIAEAFTDGTGAFRLWVPDPGPSR